MNNFAMKPVLIIGGGPSIRWDTAAKFPFDLISTDIYAYNTAYFAKKLPVCIVTLEDGDRMESMFDLNWNCDKPPVIISSRTKQKLIDYIKHKGFETKKFDNELVQVIYNVGMMAWFYAWHELGYREIHLTGFDHLINPRPSVLEQLWKDSFFEFKEYLAPKELKTYIIPSRQHKFTPKRRRWIQRI